MRFSSSLVAVLAASTVLAAPTPIGLGEHQHEARGIFSFIGDLFGKITGSRATKEVAKTVGKVAGKEAKVVEKQAAKKGMSLGTKVLIGGGLAGGGALLLGHFGASLGDSASAASSEGGIPGGLDGIANECPAAGGNNQYPSLSESDMSEYQAIIESGITKWQEYYMLCWNGFSADDHKQLESWIAENSIKPPKSGSGFADGELDGIAKDLCSITDANQKAQYKEAYNGFKPRTAEDAAYLKEKTASCEK